MSPGLSRLTRRFVRLPSRTGPVNSPSGCPTPLAGGARAGALRADRILVRETAIGAGVRRGSLRPHGETRGAFLCRREQLLGVATRTAVAGVGAEHPDELADELVLVQRLDRRARHI